ncbi:MAG: lysophospholipid acyltransferase family protein [Deltaproteobacteria bacterium]|nr:lysophospholipid acyltransferase family protein [Deltaproteobacteria bacterium]
MAEKRLHKRLKRFLRYYLLRALFAVAGLPPLELARRLGAALGGLAFLLAGGERRKALSSLAIAFGEKSEAERYEIARDSFRHLGMLGAEVCQLRHIDPQLERYVELSEGSQRLLAEAYAEKRGVVFITGHVGNFELLARRFGRLGYPSQTIAKQSSDPRMTALIERIRVSGGYQILWRGQEDLFALMERLLGRGEFLGFLIDQDIKARGVFVDFFGRPTFTPRAAADLALKTGAAVVTGFVFRRGDGGHRFEVARLPVHRSGDPDADALALTQAMTRAIEDAIRRAPHAWVWLHQRWKTRPEQAAPPSRAGDTSRAGR